MVVRDVLLPNLYFEVRQRSHELFVVRTNSIAPRIAVTPSFILIVCIFAEGAQDAFEVMFIFESNMLLDQCKACRFSVARNRCCWHLASDLNTVSRILPLVLRSTAMKIIFPGYAAIC